MDMGRLCFGKKYVWNGEVKLRLSTPSLKPFMIQLGLVSSIAALLTTKEII